MQGQRWAPLIRGPRHHGWNLTDERKYCSSVLPSRRLCSPRRVLEKHLAAPCTPYGTGSAGVLVTRMVRRYGPR